MLNRREETKNDVTAINKLFIDRPSLLSESNSWHPSLTIISNKLLTNTLMRNSSGSRKNTRTMVLGTMLGRGSIRFSLTCNTAKVTSTVCVSSAESLTHPQLLETQRSTKEHSKNSSWKPSVEIKFIHTRNLKILFDATLFHQYFLYGLSIFPP